MKKSLLSLAAVACLAFAASAQAGAPLYATGDFEASNWDAAAPVEFTYADNAYTLTIPEVSMLKMSTVSGADAEDAWGAFNSGCLMTDGNVVAGETVNLIPGDANIVFPWAGEWTLTVASDLSTLTCTTTTPAPEGFTEIYLRGGMNGWGAEAEWQLATTDGNNYVLKDVVIEEGTEWKIADANWSKVNYGVAEAGEVVVLDEPFELAYNGANIMLEGAEGEAVDVYFTLSSHTIIITAHSDAAPLYATGDFEASNWNPSAPAMFNFISGEYVLDIAGVSMFKISNVSGAEAGEGEDPWTLFNGGALQIANDAEIEAGEPMTLVAGDHNIVVPWKGDWHIVVSADLTTIVATTETPRPEGFTEIYLRGGMNGWGAEDAWKFITEDGDTYVLNGVVIPESEEWKIADADWAKVNYGVAEAGEVVVLDEPFELAYNGANIKVDYAGEDVPSVSVLFTLSDHTVVLTSTTGIADLLDNADAPRTYYNMQGIQVANPTTGAYIIKQGNKTVKAYIVK